MAIAYLARWGGAPVTERQYPYQYLLANDGAQATAASVAAPAVHMQNVLMTGTSTDSIKRAIMGGTAVAIGFYYNDSHYNEAYSSYYDPAIDAANHAVAIIGWNDNFPASRFASPPPGNGAYLVKNSWGTGWGQEGYFWMSYYEKSLDPATYAFNDSQAASNYDRIYQYDTLGNTDNIQVSIGTPNVGWMANVFKADPQGPVIRAVSFYAPVASTSYTTYVYDNIETSADSNGMPVCKPVSGTLLTTRTGRMQAGYHTVVLAAPGEAGFPVTVGKNFSVVVKLTTPGYPYPIPIEQPDPDNSSNATALQGQSYISRDGTNWDDISLDPRLGSPNTGSGTNDTNVCLKTFGSLQ